MRIKQVLAKYHKVEIELLLPYLLGKPKEFLFMHAANELTRNQQNKLARMVKRREKGEPIAYITGYKDFFGLRFKVNKNVLIPRPETEGLVDLVIASLAKQPQPKERLLHHPAKGGAPRNDIVKILDIGTGSGCIAISIAKQLQKSQISNPKSQIIASDISSEALKVAKENAKRHHAKIKLIKSDLFQNIKGRFDVIVANLPYVPEKVYESRIQNLEWEPKIALVDKVKDFDIYRRFFEQVSKHLNAKSKIYLEIDPKTKPHIAAFTKKYLPTRKAKFYKDLNNFWRIVEIS